ncbi:MAG: methyltransferase [Hyphomonadaceae bacterium]|nr:methyltransferase [Hyphomonadaceae bacterium]
MAGPFWRSRWVAWRNALLSSPGFQRWAAEFPLTRPVAHRQADKVFDLVAGFVYAQVLSACIAVRLFDHLAAGPQSTAALATATDIHSGSLKVLLAAAASIGLVERLGPDGYVLGPLGAALRGNAGLGEMIAHHRHFYEDLADPVALLRSGGGAGALAAYWPYARAADPDSASPAAVSPYSALMAASQPMIAVDVLHAYPLGRHRRVMDVGGGEGAFLLAVAGQAPSLEVVLFDLPAVAARAVERFTAAGLGARATTASGDFLKDELPQGADAITLIRVLHDHDDAGVRAILASVRRALPKGGVIVVAEPMSRAPRADPMADAYFGLYLFAMGRGRVRQPAEYKQYLAEAGFRRPRSLPARNPMLVQVVTAQA